MNRLEFTKVMEVLGIDNKVSTITGRYGTTEDVYNWNDIDICFYGSYYSIVDGKIPLEVAKRIYDKDPKNLYSIRIDGGALDNKPIDCAVSDEYNKFVTTFFQLFKGKEVCLEKTDTILERKKQEILSHNPESLYIGTYHIDTKEGLLIFLTELQDYYIGKILNEPNINIQVAKQPELLGEINRRLIEDSNPYINVEQWLEKDSGYDCEGQTIKKGKTVDNYQKVDEEKNKIKILLKEFDETINPFINNNIKLLDPIEYSDKILFNCYADDNEVEFFVKDKTKKGQVEHRRNNEYLTYTLSYGEESWVCLHHYFVCKKENPLFFEEIVCLLSHNDSQSFDLRYNLTNGLAYRTYAKDEEKRPLTPSQKVLIIDELEKAIEVAKTITINNMGEFQTGKMLKRICKRD